MNECNDGSFEVWYFTAVILVVGGLKDAEVAVDSLSICINLQVWAIMFIIGFTISARLAVSNKHLLLFF